MHEKSYTDAGNVRALDNVVENARAFVCTYYIYTILLIVADCSRPRIVAAVLGHVKLIVAAASNRGNMVVAQD